MQQLNDVEIDQVSGGVLPFFIARAIASSGGITWVYEQGVKAGEALYDATH